jgi:signal transduction histidine kinase
MLSRIIRDSFSFRIFRTFAALIIILTTVFTIFIVNQQNKIAKEELIKTGMMLAGLLANSSKTGVFAENSDLMKEDVQGILRQRSVAGVSIYTIENKLLVNELKKAHKWNTDRTDSEKKGFITKTPEEILSGIVENVDSIEISAPVLIESPANPESLYFSNESKARKEKIIGYVRVMMDKQILVEKTKDAFMHSALLVSLFLFIGCIIIFLVTRRAIGPVDRLARSAKKLGMGESFEKVPVESHDEIGRLAETFNNMSDNLRKRDKEKHMLEEKLAQAQKMEAVGTLARGIAHDFNNILATIRGSVFIMDKNIDEQSRLKHYTEQIHNSIAKAKNLVDGLLAFSRTNKINLTTVDINFIIKRLTPMLGNILGETIELETHIQDETLMIMGDSIQIEQVLMNLCMNAKDAMPDGGSVTIKTRKVNTEQYLANNNKGLFTDNSLPPDRDFVEISVADTGTGMNEAIKDRIFEPFFTTKQVGKGTGLGLSIVYGIIEQHKGHIDVHTKKGEGTEFRIYIPLEK